MALIVGFRGGSFACLHIHNGRSRGGGNVGIAAAISKDCGKGGKDSFIVFPTLPIVRHFHGLFREAQLSCDRSRQA